MTIALPPPVLNLNPNWASLGSSDQDQLREQLRTRCQNDLYFLAKGILGYDKLVKHFHLPLCRLTQDETYPRTLSLLPRGTYKTTIRTKANNIRRILKDPNVRILIANATADNSVKILGEIKLQFETNELLHWLFPEIIPDFATATHWNSHEIRVKRNKSFSESTVEAIGVGGNVTSRHYNVHIKDDVIDEKIAASATEMQKVKDWLAYTEGAFVNPGTDIEDIIGTRYALNDPYGEILSEAIPSVSDLPGFYNRPFVSNGYLCFMRSARERDETGAEYLTIPELLNDITLHWIKGKQGKRIFSAQFLNFPFTSENKGFKKEWLCYWDWTADGFTQTIRIKDTGEMLPLSSLFISIRIDPTTGESVSTNDRTAIIVDGIDAKGRIFILEAWAKKCKPSEWFKQYVAFYRKHKPAKSALEKIAGFKVLGPQLKDFCRKENVSPYFVELTGVTGKSKEGRITAYDSRFEDRKIFIRPTMTDFIHEYENYPDPSVPDDLLDAFCYGDQVWDTPVDTAAQDQWDREERQVLKFRQMTRTGY